MKKRIAWNKGIKASQEVKDKMSQSVKQKYAQGIRTPYWLGKTRTEVDKLKFSLSHKGKTLSDSTKKLLSISHSKERHWAWKEDRTQVKVGDRSLNDPLQKQWRFDVKTRDNWKCKIADEKCKGKIEAHHILSWRDYPELRYKINNGIALCHAHHPRRRSEEKRLAPIFTKLLS